MNYFNYTKKNLARVTLVESLIMGVLVLCKWFYS